MLQICEAGGAHSNAYSAIFGRITRARTPTALCGGVFSSSGLLWPRIWSAIFLLPRPLQAGPAPP